MGIRIGLQTARKSSADLERNSVKLGHSSWQRGPDTTTIQLVRSTIRSGWVALDRGKSKKTWSHKLVNGIQPTFPFRLDF